MAASRYDVVIIGAGFYGMSIALFLRKYFRKIIILERNTAAFTQASFANQARVHNGYHYPRSFVTASRSHINYRRFIRDFPDCVNETVLKLYAIASQNSKTSANQFISFCRRVHIPLRSARVSTRQWFHPHLIEQVFEVEESVFDAKRLSEVICASLDAHHISVAYDQEVLRVREGGHSLEVVTTRDTYTANYVFNCTYAGINAILERSHLPRLPFKYEMTEVALVQVPNELSNVGITVMDGPFFSLMPFPALNEVSLTHVRYTPHYSFSDGDVPVWPRASQYLFMKKDAQRYMPILRQLRYKKSLYAIKTLLMENEIDDGRPILFRKDYGFKHHHVIMGAKIDNIYDIYSVLSDLFS